MTDVVNPTAISGVGGANPGLSAFSPGAGPDSNAPHLGGLLTPGEQAAIAVAVGVQTNAWDVWFMWNTTVPVSQQDGTQLRPYSNLQTACDLAMLRSSTVRCVGLGAPTNLSSAGQSFTANGQGINLPLNIVAENGNCPRTPCFINVGTLTNHTHVTMQGCQVSDIVGDTSRLWASNCIYGHIGMSAGNVRLRAGQPSTPGDTSIPWSVGNIDCGNGSTLAIWGMKIAGNLIIGGGTATFENTIQQCDINPGGFALFVGNAATTVYVDEFSLKRGLLQAPPFDWGTNNTGILNILDPCSSSLYFGASAGAIAADSFLGFASLANLAAEATNQIPAFAQRIVRNLRVKSISGNVTVANCIVTVRKNGVDTPLTCTVVNGTAVAQDLSILPSHWVSFAPGDNLSVKITGNGTTLPGPLRVSVEVD